MITELLDRALGLNKINLLNEADFEVYDEVDDEDKVDIDTEADEADGADDDEVDDAEVDDDIGEIEKGEAQDELDKIIDNIENVTTNLEGMSREEIEKDLLGTTEYFTPKQWDNSTATIQIDNQEGKPIGEVSARDIAATSDPIEFWTIVKQQIDDPNDKESINQMLEKEDYDENEIRKYYWKAIQKIAQETRNEEAFKTASTILKNGYYNEKEETAPANEAAKKYQESAADAQEKRYRKHMEEVIGLNPETLDKMAWTTSDATVKKVTRYKKKGNITIGKKDPFEMKNNWNISSAGDIQQYTIYDTNDKIVANITDKSTHRFKPGNYYIKTKADGAWEIAITGAQAPGFNRLAHVVAATTQSRSKFWDAVDQIAQDAGATELLNKIQEMKKTGDYDEKLETLLRKQARETLSERLGKFFKSSGLKDLPPDRLGISKEQIKIFRELANKKQEKERKKTIYEGDTIYGVFKKDGKMIRGGFDTAIEAEEYLLDNDLNDAEVQDYPNDRSLSALSKTMGPREQGWTTGEVTKALTPWIRKLAIQTWKKFGNNPQIELDDLMQDGKVEALEAFKRDDGSTPFAGYAYRNIANRMMSKARHTWEKMSKPSGGGKTDIESTKERGWELIWKDPKDQPDAEPHKMIFQSSLPGGVDPDNLETDDGYLRVNNEKQNLINKGIPEKNIEINTTKTLKLGDPTATMKKIKKSLLKKDTSEKIDSYVVLWINKKDEEKRKEFESLEKAKEYKNELLKTGIPEDNIKVKTITKSLIRTKAPSEFNPELTKKGGTLTHYQIIYKDKDGDTVEADRLPSLKDKPGERYTTTSDKNYQKLAVKLAKLIDSDKVLWDDETKSHSGNIVKIYSGQPASIEKTVQGDEGEEGSTIGAQIRSPITTPEQISARKEKIFNIMKKAELTKKEEDVLLASYGMEVSHYENKWDPKKGKEVPTKVIDIPALAPEFRGPEEKEPNAIGWVVKYKVGTGKKAKEKEQKFESSIEGGIDKSREEQDHGYLSMMTFVDNLKEEGITNIDIQRIYPEFARAKLIKRPETKGLVDPNEIADLLKSIHPDIKDSEIVNTIRNMAIEKMKEAVGKKITEWVVKYKQDGKPMEKSFESSLPKGADPDKLESDHGWLSVKNFLSNLKKAKGVDSIKVQEVYAQPETPVTITKQEFMAQAAPPPPKKPRPTETPEDKLDKALGINTPEDKLDKARRIAKQAKENQDKIKRLSDEAAAKKRRYHKGTVIEPDEEMVSAEETDRAEQLAILEYLILRDLKVIA